MSLPGASPPPASSKPEREPPGPVTFSPTGAEPKPLKQKASPQLNRWSMARAIKSGRKLDRPVGLATRTSEPSSSIHHNSVIDSPDANTGLGIHGDEDVESAASSGKSIYMVSDGTGWTADHAVHAALGQFEHCLADRGCSVNTHLISGQVEDEEQLVEIVMQAAKEGAMLIYTLADPSMAESAKRACNLWGVQSTDILSPITEAIASHLVVSPSGISRGAAGRTKTLNEEYFKRIEAIEFTIKQDDGTLPENLHKADIVLVGVSRTGKTPLSTYLAHKGYKVANLPVVMGVELPKILFEVDQRKVFGLTIRPVALQAIRRARAKTLGLGVGARSSYSEMDYVREELEFAGRIFAKNPTWPVIDVTNKAIEETAAVVLRMFHDGRQKTSMPRISKRYLN